jgi:hypothetical protein
MNTKSLNSLRFRLKILLRRESLVWMRRRSAQTVNCGWLLNCKSETVLFKDKNVRGAQTITIDDIKACGIV